MPTNTSGGTTTSFFNTPQATDNCYTADEDCVYYFDVMSDDLGGSAKVLWSIDDNDLYGTTTTSADGTTTTTTNVDTVIDLTVKDATGCVEKSALGASISIVDGKVKYDARALDWLADGQTATDYFTYAIRLANGTLSWATVAITLTGSNDAPTIVSATAVGDVTEKDEPAEGGTLSDTGTIAFADVDLTDTHSATVSAAVLDENGDPVASPLGDLTLGSVDEAANSVGWTYSVNDSTLDFLAADETRIQIYTITINDGHTGGNATQTVTITITGTNDAPVLTVDQSGGVTEDLAVVGGNLADSGVLSFADVDVTDAHTVTKSYNGDATWSGGSLTAGQIATLTAGLTVDSNSWDYSLANAAVQFLGAGETITLSFDVTVTDDSGAVNNSDTQTVTLIITGTNDAPVLTVDQSGGVTEDLAVVGGNLADSGVLSFADLDVTDTHTVTKSYNGDAIWSGGSLTAGEIATLTAGFTVDSNSWDYSLANAAVQFLGAGETITLSFDVTVTDDSGAGNDSDTQTVTLTITGTNDAPVLADTTDPTAVLEAVDASAQDLSAITGSFSVTDLDVGDTLSASVVGGPTVLLGGNPFVLPAGAAALTAAGAFTFNPTSTTSTGGAIAIGYSYDPGVANFDFLRAGQSLTITYQVQVGDGLATSAVQDVTFTITGTNDAPVLSGDLAAPINEGGTYQLTTADLNFTDPDDGAANVTFTVTGLTNGTLYVNGVAGNTFTGAQLAAGLVTFQHDGSETLTAGFQVSVEDGNQDLSAPVAQAFNFTVTAVNDAPVNGVPGAQSVNEDNALVFSTANGNPISISDADAGVGTVRVTLSVGNGTLTLGSLSGLTFTAGTNGSGSFTIEGTQAAINTALQGLIYQGNLNYFGPDSISIVTSDLGNSGSGGALTDSDSVAITVNAVNDAPVASPVTLAAIAEDSGARLITQAELLAGVTDVDGPPATITTLSVAAGSGMLSSNGDGTWTYMPALNDDTSVTFNYTASDGSLSSNSTAMLDITSVNDAPVNSVPAGQSINAGTSLVFSSGTSNAISISDVDAGSNTVQAMLSVTNGTLTLGSTTGLTITSGANGSSSVTVQGSQAAINAALQGLAYLANLSFSGSDSLSIVTSDLGNSGAGGTLWDTDSIAITVNAVRAAPTDIRLTMTSPLLDPNNLNISIQGTLTATDPDPGAFTFTFSGGGTTLANSGTNFQISGATFSSTSNIGQNATYILPIVVTQAGDGVLSWTETFRIITGSNQGADPLTGNATGDDILYGGGGAESIMGLGGDDTIFGHQEGDLLLSGGAGRDTIYGGDGNDTLNGGADADIFVFNIAANNSSNHDTIQDFEANGVDLIHLDNAVFTQLTATGTLSSANFASNAGGTATDGNDYILFDTSTGNLYYDPDGNGGTARLLIATLTVTAGTIDPTDILII